MESFFYKSPAQMPKALQKKNKTKNNLKIEKSPRLFKCTDFFFFSFFLRTIFHNFQISTLGAFRAACMHFCLFVCLFWTKLHVGHSSTRLAWRQTVQIKQRNTELSAARKHTVQGNILMCSNSPLGLVTLVTRAVFTRRDVSGLTSISDAEIFIYLLYLPEIY